MVELRDITRANFDECIQLKVAADQAGFVADNLMSIAQSKVLPNLEVKAVYHGEEMVGFVMYGLESENGRYYLVRLMVGEKHQGKGHGRAATLAVIERLSAEDGCDEVYLSFVPENAVAEKLYDSIGFVKTGEIDEGEIVMKFGFSK